MKRPWTKRFARWLRTRSFTSQVVFFAGGILLFLVLLAFLEYRGGVAVHRATQEQADVHSLNRRLANLGRSVQSVRSLQLQMCDNPANDKLGEVNATLFSFEKNSIALADDLKIAGLGNVAKSFAEFRVVFNQYENSTTEILSIQQKLGYRGFSGLIDQLRIEEETIIADFEELKRNDLIVEFNAIQFAERDYVRTLNMKYSGEIAQMMTALLLKIEALNDSQPVIKNNRAKLATYNRSVEEFSRHILELELRTAAATLAYTRSEVPLRKTEEAIDAKLTSLGMQLRDQRTHTARLQMLTFVASGAFVLLLLTVLLRGTLQLNFRLKRLATRMATVSTHEEGIDIAQNDTYEDDLTALTTSFENMSDRIARQIATVEAARDQANRANEAKSRFIATVSHEVRTPMNGLLTTLQLMEQTKLDSEQREYVDIMRLSGDRMLELLSDLLDFSKIEADRIILRSDPFSLHSCVENAVLLFQASAREKGLDLVLSLAKGTPEFVIGDSLHLRQVLLNLISNAIKFTESGKVDIVVTVNEQSEQSHTEIAFTIRDTGIGIAPSEQEKLFDPFSQVDGTATRRHAGTGLGLAICDRIIKLAGGELLVESTIGVGTTFSFAMDFKVHATPIAPKLEGRTVVLPTKLAEEIPLRILVAEDDATTRRTMARLFKRLGYKPTIVKDGQEAVDTVTTERIDLVFMDMQMPVLDGLRATELIRESFADDALVIIGLSGNASEADQRRCMDAGMNDFLPKPFELEEFVAMLRRWGRANSSNTES